MTTVTVAILRVQLPIKEAYLGQTITLGPNIYPTVVNEKWRIPPMEKATFRFGPWFMFWDKWQLIERIPPSDTPRQEQEKP